MAKPGLFAKPLLLSLLTVTLRGLLLGKEPGDLFHIWETSHGRVETPCKVPFSLIWLSKGTVWKRKGYSRHFCRELLHRSQPAVSFRLKHDISSLGSLTYRLSRSERPLWLTQAQSTDSTDQKPCNNNSDGRHFSDGCHTPGTVPTLLKYYLVSFSEQTYEQAIIIHI